MVKEPRRTFNVSRTAQVFLSQGVGETLWPLAGLTPELAEPASRGSCLPTNEGHAVGHDFICTSSY